MKQDATVVVWTLAALFCFPLFLVMLVVHYVCSPKDD